MIPQIHLRRGKEESLLRRHPWIFSGAIESVRYDGNEIPEGALVDVYTRSGDFIARGHYQIGSIAVRVLTFEQEPIDAAWWQRMISTALDVRRTLGLTDAPDTTCYRLVHGEGDSLPGLVVDIYDTTAVIQCHSVGMYHARLTIADAIRTVYGDRITAIYDKSSQTVPFKAGLNPVDGYLYGKTGGMPRTVLENGEKFLVNWEEGQKTGFFIDQRFNRDWYAATPEDARSSIPSATRADFRYMLLRAEHAKYARSTPRSGPSPWPTPTFGSTSEKRLPTLRWPSMPSNTSRTSATGTT